MSDDSEVMNSLIAVARERSRAAGLRLTVRAIMVGVARSHLSSDGERDTVKYSR